MIAAMPTLDSATSRRRFALGAAALALACGSAERQPSSGPAT